MTIEVDPIEAVVALARADSGLSAITSNRIDHRHHFGQSTGDWPRLSRSLALIPSGGDVNVDIAVQRPLFEVRCYGDSHHDAMKVFKKLQDFCRVNERRTVAVTEGDALVYWVTLRTAPRQLVDPTSRDAPFVSAMLQAEVAELTVT